MGLLDRLKAGGRGVMTAADPAPGTSAAPVEEVRRRLLEISGRGIETSQEGDDVIVTWSATVRRSGGGPHATYDRLYRAVRVELDSGDATAAGACLKATAEADVHQGELSGSKKWERGQHIGSESLRVVAWGGAVVAEGAADEEGFKFRWADLRDPVIDAVTGAGWTYRPKRI